MDFLDPKKQRRHARMLIVGYGLVGAAILLATIVLLEVAYGFGITKGGEVVQNGLVFVSSTPSGATIALSGVANQSQTNTRLSLVSGNYQMTLTRPGYHSWHQSFSLEGGSVFRIDYPFLFPQQLVTTPVKTYNSTPGLATQSLDKRWLLVQVPGSVTDFDLFDLKNSKTVVSSTLSLPASLISTGTAQSWSVVEWADDNQHVLLSHNYDGKTEFIIFDRTDPAKSVNLNRTLNTNPTKVSLFNEKYDQYYVYDASAQTLQTARLTAPTLQPLLTDVLSYHTYGDNIVLYASSRSATAGKVAIDLLQSGKTYLLREAAANTTYLLDIARYSGNWYAAVGASSENKVYVYKNPVTQLNSRLATLVPVYVLKTVKPVYVSFSANAQYLMDENGSQFAVYDALYDKGYHYDSKLPLDTPQEHASWMDIARLTYVSGGKLVVLDFDNANHQTLGSSNPNFMPFFTPDYKYVETMTSAAGSQQTILNSTALRTSADL